MLKKEKITGNLLNGIWEIIMIIFIIGLINIYIIHKYGIEGIYPIIEGKIGILNIKESNIIMLIIINTIMLIIFNNGYKEINKYNENYKGVFSIEYIYLLSMGILGLNIIILSNDLIFIFISLELYSLSVYLLILLKITKNTTRISIIYLLINSLSSYLLLLGISIIYKYSGSIILEEISYILYDNNNNSNIGKIGIIFIIISILIKLGIVPFNFWVLRVYSSLESRILLYQIIIPKIVYLYLLYKIIDNFIPILINSGNISNILIYIYILGVLSTIIASIGGLFNNYFKKILTYSSILNMGFILLGMISNILIENNKYSFYEYLLIYTFNTLAIFFCFLLINPNSDNKFFNPKENINDKYKNIININKKYPIFTIFLLFTIFSFIGIPPFAGFYAKLNIFLNILNSYNEIWYISLIFLLIGTFISACFYIKFILYFFIKNININENNFLISNKPFAFSYYFSFFSLFLISYPFISNYLYPYYILLL